MISNLSFTDWRRAEREGLGRWARREGLFRWERRVGRCGESDRIER